jgi:hypothetical protein
LLAARIGPLQVQGPFFGYFLLGLEKKVTRLPAGTGEVAFKRLCFNFKTGTSKPAGRAPPGALLFVSRQKVSKKRLPLRGALLSRGPE